MSLPIIVKAHYDRNKPDIGWADIMALVELFERRALDCRAINWVDELARLKAARSTILRRHHAAMLVYAWHWAPKNTDQEDAIREGYWLACQLSTPNPSYFEVHHGTR